MNKVLFMLGLSLLPCGCGSEGDVKRPTAEDSATREGTVTTPSETTPPDKPSNEQPANEAVATFGAGCFWCVEAVLLQVNGVKTVVSGYMGGTVENPTYKQICTGMTGHAEVVQITYDPDQVSYDTLLDWFWKLHDPTTLNRQGNDRGPQYRSVIFSHSEEQAKHAAAAREALERAGRFEDPIVTEITAASTFYKAEGYHQDYYQQNKSQSYCRFIIAPKLGKLGLEK